ncbi:hypothetical protein AVEN_273174-1, partial [Araneus ventricosus]
EDIENIYDPQQESGQGLQIRMIPMSLNRVIDSNGYIYAIGYTNRVTSPKQMVQILIQNLTSGIDAQFRVNFKPEITAIQCRICISRATSLLQNHVGLKRLH